MGHADGLVFFKRDVNVAALSGLTQRYTRITLNTM